MLIDATEPVSEPDKKLASYIAQEFKPVVLVINKWDLARESLQAQAKEQGGKFDDHGIMEEYRKYLDAELKHLDYAPIAFVTAKEGKNVQAVVDLAQHLYKQANIRISTHKLNTVVKQILEEQRPTTPTGRRARIYYVTQSDVAPPTIVFFVNNPEFLNDAYQRFMINRFRELLPYGEVPIKLHVRQRERQSGAIKEMDAPRPTDAARTGPKAAGRARPKKGTKR
jgi:GTP-binding protein